jgi:hypothetical protein
LAGGFFVGYPTLAIKTKARRGWGTQIFVGKNQGAVSMRKARHKEVAYNYIFLGENLGYSEQETERF